MTEGTDFEKEFSKMSLEQLVTFCEEHNDDWDTDVPKWTDPMERHLKRALKQERLDMTLHDLEVLDLRMAKIGLEYLDRPLREAMDHTRALGYLWDTINELKSDIDRIRISVKMLLKEDENERANITRGKLNKVLGGIPIS